MPKQIKIYKVTAPFPFGGIDYTPGDEFAIPANWEEKDGKFLEPYDAVITDEKGERVKETFYRTLMLPVTANA